MLGGGRGSRDRCSPRRRTVLLADHEAGLLVDQEALGSDDQAEVVVPQPAGDPSRARPVSGRPVTACQRAASV